MNRILRTLGLSMALSFLAITQLAAQGESSTYFNIFVPPNNDPVKRNVSLIVTAIFDDTHFDIVDDGADGDTDDSKTGVLQAGQSYVLYIADNGINDDARYASGGTLKQDGDYFIIHSSKNILVSQSTNSDWQHDFVPALGQKGIGERFIVYAPPVSSSKRDLNTFVYEDSTLVTIKRISLTPTTVTGFTDVDASNAVTIGSKLLNRGQDIIYFSTLGRDVMETGHTYLVEASKPITLQYGALYGNERDGGGNVPSSNGSSSGDLFYFGVPYQSGGEQEIRIVSWDDANSVTLERFNNGTWVKLKSWSLNRHGFSSWVGKTEGNASYSTVFRITASAGKRVSVFEANWLETGNPGTSDIGSMLSSEDGTSAGTKFIAYIAPPGNEANVMDPFTGKLFGQQLSHLYISSRTGAQVTVKDAYTQGKDFSRTYTISPERYVDCALTLTEWKNIYNGTGTVAGGPERPYLIVESDKPVSVFNTNFNDNWMAYLGTSQVQEFSLQSQTPPSAIIPGDTTSVITKVVMNGSSPAISTSAVIEVTGNASIVSSEFSSGNTTISGAVSTNNAQAVFNNLPQLNPGDIYSFETKLVATTSDNQGKLFLGNSVGTITTSVTATVDGTALQAVSSDGIFINSADQSQLLFTKSTDNQWNTLKTDSWAVSLVDYNNDGMDDIFITDRDKTKPNYLFKNTGSQAFTRVTSGVLVNDLAQSVSSSWADTDNDGDLDVLIANNTEKPNALYMNDGSGNFVRNTKPGFVQQPAYFHNASWVDYDNDGLLDLFLCNYWPTKFNELWHNDGNGNFSLQTASTLSQTAGNSASATWQDYDLDGLPDLFLPNNKGGLNQLFHNDGQGRFTQVNSVISKDGGNSVASCWGDIDGNGYPDLFVANASDQDNYLYLNNGKEFKKITSGAVVQSGGHSHGCSFADIDNDGDLDLYVNNDRGAKFLYLNNGDGTLAPHVNESITSDYGFALGHAWSDLDKDGDLDLFSVTHTNQPNYLFWNNGNSNHWLEVKLNGTQSNRSAVGARIRVKCDGKWQSREVVSQSGIGGQSSYRNHFGLGTQPAIDSLIIYWPSGIQQVFGKQEGDQRLAITEPAGTVIKGELYIDANANCKRDSDERPLANYALQVTPANVTLVTDQQGIFHVTLSEGEYELRALAENGYRWECQPAVTVKASSSTSEISIEPIGLKPLCNCADASVKGYTTAMRRGFGNDYHVEVSNQGNLDIEKMEVIVRAPSALAFTSATPKWDNQRAVNNEQEYTWTITGLKGQDAQSIVIRDSVTLAMKVNDLITITSEVKAASDAQSSNDVYTDLNQIVGSIDPNMLLASPSGFGENNLLESTQEITYTILFQNEGTHATSLVTVIDTLAEGFDLSTLHAIETSHQPAYVSIRDRVLTAFFPTLELSPAAVDSTASQGFVQFRVRPYSNFAGTIRNQASIIFDYNEPFPTNAVAHTIYSVESTGSLNIFPNPAADFVTMALWNEGESGFADWMIMDVHGRVYEQGQSSGKVIRFDTRSLPVGLYLVKGRTNDGHELFGKLMVKR